MFTELGIGIDRSHFLPKHSRLDLSTYFAKLDFHRCIRFICVSRLEKSKMVDHAILAMKIFGKENLNFKLFIIGDGRERNHLEALVNSEKLSQNVIFLGNRSQKWIAGAFNCVDINIAPLCGRSLLEASLAGLPSVAYDLDWHSEIVINNQTGFLVSPLNIDELSAKSLLLASNQDLRKIMSINMLRHANSIADPAKIAKRQADLYLKLIFENQL
jgi:glycosyltransferase involved in cell wall biosynthesis